jgi:CHAT domain-containing protein/Tfp pilus assembly protein PilF
MKTSRLHSLSRIGQAAAVFLTLLATTTASGQAQSADVRELKFGGKLAREIAAGEVHQYRLALRPRQALFVELEEQSFDVKVELVKAGASAGVAASNVGGGFDREELIFTAEEAGDYLLRVETAEDQFGSGSYRFSARLADALTEKDKTRLQALRLLSEAAASQKENTAEDIRGAIARREQALALWQKIGDTYWEGRTLDRLGTAHQALLENNKAVEYLNRALQIVSASGDKPLEAATLNTIGSLTNGFGENQQAIEYHTRALQIFQKAKNAVGVMATLKYLGNAYIGLKDYVKANQYYQESLALSRKAGNKDSEAYALYLLGTALDAQNDKPKALEQYNQSLTLWRKINNTTGIAMALSKIGQAQASNGAVDEAIKNLSEASELFQSKKIRYQEASTYTNLAGLYFKSGKIAEAIEVYKKSLAFYQGIKFRPLEIIMTGTLAIFYQNLPDLNEAIKYAEAALAIEETVPERWSEASTKLYKEAMKNSKAMTLQTLGQIYFNSGDTERALKYNYQVLSVFEKKDDPESKRRALASLQAIAQTHQYRYEWDKAIENYNRALQIATELKDRGFTVLILNSIGIIYSNTGDKKKALESYTKALEELRLIPDRGDQEKVLEASILNNIGRSHLYLGDPKGALEYHGQALAILQEIKDVTFIDHQATAYMPISSARAYLGESESAIKLLDKALELYRQAPQRVKDLARNRTTEASILNNLGLRHKDTGDFRKAMEYYNQALQLALDTKREDMEASALNNIALVYQAYGEPRKALQNLTRALEIDRKLKDADGEATILNNIGQVYSDFGDKREALKYTNQALEIVERVGNKDGIPTCLNNIGNAYTALSENDKALVYFNRALAIARETGNRTNELTSLDNIAILYSHIGERGKALDNYQEALSIARSIGNRDIEATILGNMAFDYLELGENQTALEYRSGALKISREIGNRSLEIYGLNGVAAIHYKTGERSKTPEEFRRALSNYEQGLRLSRETENRLTEADALLGIGRVYVELNESAKALPALTQSLDYSKKYHGRFFEDAAHLALGRLYEKNGEFDKAVEAYQESLLVARAITDRDIEAKALKGLMSAWKVRGNTRLAIFYGKQAVNRYQELRGSIRNLRRETQDVYRDKVTDVYRELADLLIAAGLLRDAEQVLAMLKEQEAFEFVRRDASEAEDLLSKHVIPDPREQKALAEYARLVDELTAKSRRLDALELKPELSQAEKDEAQKLRAEVDGAKEGVLAFFKRLEPEFSRKSEGSPITAGTVGSFQAQLREAGPGVVLITTYLLPQRYRVIVSTGRTMVDRKVEYRSVGLDGERVNKKIMEFKSALQSPDGDPRPPGKELYDIFFKPIESDIKNARAKTLLWSLDGSLRYVPVAALYDGRRYLAERYQNVLVTLGQPYHLFDKPARRDWRVLGLGVSKQYKNFRELPSVPFELTTIVHDERISQDEGGVLSGIRLLDSDFTQQSFIDNLRPVKHFNVVHLATHFHLGSNLDNSGLLLGDGNILSLYTINRDSAFDFNTCDLLTLSACETGVSVEDSNGGEVESLGMIAQNHGAKAVLATLWKVADRSTAILMSEFYRLRKADPGLTKSEALRLAQVEMLEGKLGPRTAARERRDTGEAEAPGAPAPPHAYDLKRPYAHPYYWSPFILIGNWR